MYVNRETGLLRNSLFDHDLTPTATTVRDTRSGSRGREVARPTASKRWRLNRKHGRRRPAAGVTTTKQQRPVRQEETAT